MQEKLYWHFTLIQEAEGLYSEDAIDARIVGSI